MTLLSIAKMAHLWGLIMGFGGAILADLLILQYAILRPIEPFVVRVSRALSHIVFGGLALLWVSGAALVFIRVSADPHVWANEKIWAKVMIVAILTINGIAVHRIAMGHLASRIGFQLFDQARLREMAALTFIAAVSSVSWVVPFVLGTATEFNFTVKATTILTVYVVLVGLAWSAFYTLARFVTKPNGSALPSPKPAAILAGNYAQQHEQLMHRLHVLSASLKRNHTAHG